MKPLRSLHSSVCRRRGIAAGLAWLLVLGGFCVPAFARGYDVHPPVDPHHVDGSLLGGLIDLSSTWLVKQGDDRTYADPQLDDSKWLTIQSGPPLASYGFKNVDDVWYRTHVRIPPGRHRLGLSLQWFAGSCRIYVNGVQVGSSKTFPPGGADMTLGETRFSLPDGLVASGELTIAVHARLRRASLGGTSTAGFLRITTLLLGPESQLADNSALFYFRDATSNITNLVFEVLLLLIASALAMTLRTEREYLALIIYLAALASTNALDTWRFMNSIPNTDGLILLGAVLGAIKSVAVVEFVRLVLGLPRTRFFAAYETLVVIYGTVATFTFRHLLLISDVSIPASTLIAMNVVGVIVFLPAGAGLPLLALWTWWRRRNPDALLIFVPLFANAAVSYIGLAIYILYQLHVRAEPFFGEPPIEALHVGWDEIATLCTSVTLLLFLVLRTLRIARARAVLASEFEAARTVQQLLLARASQATPGFTVESVYHPASEVGGDFFLVSPAGDGSLVAIVGDVSGKGLLAAMRVSMILGVLRREDSRDPGVILAGLNEALLTQGEMGFTTACCVRLERSGRYTVANAGHISPYVGGYEVETSPALPLGLAAGQVYSLAQGEIPAGQRLVLMSDGVVEARSASGELYGFARLPHLTLMPAHDIADLAQRFGQEDDITVLTIACAA